MIPLMFKLPNFVQGMKDSVVLRKKKNNTFIHRAFFFFFHNCNWVTLHVCDFITSVTLNILEAQIWPKYEK